MTFVLVSVLFLGLCLGVEVLARRVRLSPELVRKLAHMSAAVFAAFLPLVLTFAEIAALGLLFAVVMAVSVRLRIFSAIHGVSRTTYGEMFFPLGIAALAILCPSELPFAYGVLVLGLGDGLAALVGGRLGRRVVPLLQTSKTLWGSGDVPGRLLRARRPAAGRRRRPAVRTRSSPQPRWRSCSLPSSCT